MAGIEPGCVLIDKVKLHTLGPLLSTDPVQTKLRFIHFLAVLYPAKHRPHQIKVGH